MEWSIIRNDEQYFKALERLDQIFDTANNPEYSEEFDLLTLLINTYESENYAIEPADPIQVIYMKMDYMGLRQKDLIPLLGSKATVSKILNYKIPLTLRHIWILHEKLHLPLELLAQPYRLGQWGYQNISDTQVKTE